MNILKRDMSRWSAYAIVFACALTGWQTHTEPLTHFAGDLPKIHTRYEVQQALELLPRKLSARVPGFADYGDLRPFVLRIVRQALPAQFKSRAFEVARAVIKEGNYQHLDPLFLLAVIRTESRFNIKARGSHGEIGLMQVRPRTARWFAHQLGLPKRFSLENPAINIRVGAAYFAYLRHHFHGIGNRYVAAYNMGSRNVLRLVAQHASPRLYPARVLGQYVNLYQSLTAIQSNTENIASR